MRLKVEGGLPPLMRVCLRVMTSDDAGNGTSSAALVAGPTCSMTPRPPRRSSSSEADAVNTDTLQPSSKSMHFQVQAPGEHLTLVGAGRIHITESY